jgi:hypothetical protein
MNEDVPRIALSPSDLEKRMEQAFTVHKSDSVTSTGDKPKVKGKIRPPAVKLAPKSAVKPPAKKPVPKKKPQAKPDVRSLLGLPPKEPAPAPPYSEKPRRKDAGIGVSRVGEMFTVNPVNIRALERQSVREKIVNNVEVPRHLKAKFLAKLKQHQDAITEFMLLEIATFDLAVPTAMENLNEYLADCIGAAPQVTLGNVEPMIDKITEVKVLHYLAKLAGLTPQQVAMLVRTMHAPKERRREDPLRQVARALMSQRQQQPAPPPPVQRRPADRRMR